MNIVIIILTFTLFITSKGYSATSISIIGACTDVPLHQEFYTEVPEGWSIGELTINFLDANQIPYIGSIESIGEIESIPTEEHELIVISDEEINAISSSDAMYPEFKEAVLGLEKDLRNVRNVSFLSASALQISNRLLEIATLQTTFAQCVRLFLIFEQ